MIHVTKGNEVELLVQVSNFNMEQSIDGTFTVSFTCFQGSKNPGYDLLESESIVTVEGNDFRVKQYSNTAHSKTVIAASVFYDLTKVQRHDTFGGNHTLQNHVDFTLNGTGWTAIIDNDIARETNYIRSFGKSNIVSLVKKICKYHDIEYLILPDKKIHFKKEIGGDYDYQYRYKHNVSSVILQEDTTDLATIIKGYGADGLTVEYRSPNVAIFGPLEAEPVSDERYTNRQTLLDYIKSQLQDVPELAIESTIPELTSREIGERVWLIYEPLNIEIQTRILQQVKVLRNGELITQSVIFGNSLPKTAEDVLVDQKEDLDDTKENLDEAKEELKESINETKKEFQSKIEQTDSQITIEVEQLEKSIASIDVKADNINFSVNNRITNEVAAIDIRANKIELSVSNNNERVGRAESRITQTENQIKFEVVKQDEFTGRTITSKINMDPYAVSISADKINLNGAVVVNGSISGATDINVNRDIYMGRRLYFSDMTSVGGSSGTILLDAYNDIEYVGRRHIFWGDVDFSNARVGNLDANTIGGLKIAYNNAFVYIRDAWGNNVAQLRRSDV
ncbi:phage tail protein [Lysinibacillus sp. RC79]|uniref:phage tail protein n=1 Tax=Lysinibacillus sp. RC79 TaxID=3156296 RepID=UPI003514FCCE